MASARARAATRAAGPPADPNRCRCQQPPLTIAVFVAGALSHVERIHWRSSRCGLPLERIPAEAYWRPAT